MKIRPIHTEVDLATAKDTLSSLLLTSAAGNKDEDIEVLSILIEEYERKSVVLDPPSPVAAIRFRMEQMGLTPRQLEPFIGSRARVSEVLSEKRSLSIDMIRSLHEGLGIPYESLISRRSRPVTSEIDVPRPTIKRLRDIGFSLDRDELSAFVKSSFSSDYAGALHKRTRTQRAASKTDQSALLVWQAAILKKSESNRPSRRFSRSNLTADIFRRIAVLSSKQNGPQKAIEALFNLGISVVVLPSLPGTFLDGATMLAGDGSPIIGLTLRYDKVDSFWFTLLHEMAHVHLHLDELKKTHVAFIDDMEIRSEERVEREADELARNSLIPPKILSTVVWDESTSQDEIIALATRARVHVSIVAGRWQRDHQNYRKFARMIERDTLRNNIK